MVRDGSLESSAFSSGFAVQPMQPWTSFDFLNFLGFSFFIFKMRGIELGNLFLRSLAILKHGFVFAYKMFPYYIDIPSPSKKNFRMHEQGMTQKLQTNR